MLHATQEKSKIELIAKELDTTKITVKATGGVMVYYQDSLIKASSALYNKETKLLTLDGNVEMIGPEGTKEHTKHLEIITDKKDVTFEELFFVNENDVWLFSDKAHRLDGQYTLGTTILSSCDMNNPLWKMVFSHALYDSEAKYMKVYGAKVYFADIPVFYSPYLAFSSKRSSGLLFPLFGYSAKEGFVYEQPIFWAISPSMDMEFNPQIRTSRSVGLYSTFRFVDTAHSSGKLRVGYFRDSQAYQEREKTKDLAHYGVEFLYDSSTLFSDYIPKGFKDGLYINTIYLNDIDYLNLQKSHLQHFGLTPLQESRLNYYLYDNDYYAGVNAKYFLDTRKESNVDTLQILPSLQLHKYLAPLIWDNLSYSIDFHINNFDRKEGVTLKQAEVKVPLEFTYSFLDDFLNISLGEELYYSKFFFGNGVYEHNTFQYYSNIHQVKLFTDLVKKYKGFIHIFQPSVAYIKPGNESAKPVDFNALDTDQKSLFTVGLPQEHYDFTLSHYFYDTNMRLKFYQRISQQYYMNREYKLADMRNEMQYNWRGWQFYNELIYSHEFSKVRESSSRISLNEKEYRLSINHSFKRLLSHTSLDQTVANDINFDFRYSFNEQVKFNGGFTYNIDKASSTQWRVGGGYKRDCWSVDFSVREDIIPRPAGVTKENTLYVQFNFIPFGGGGIGTGAFQ